MLAHVMEIRGDHSGAEDAWTRALSKARALHDRDSDDQTEQWIVHALDGLGRLQRMRGALEQAVGTHREQLAIDPSDPLEVRGSLSELELLLGDANAALATSEAVEEPSAGDFLVRALAFLEAGNPRGAVIPARRALLHNPLLVAALIGEEMPEIDLHEGDEEDPAEEARELAERLQAWLEVRPERLDAITTIATAPAVMQDVEAWLAVHREFDDDLSDEDQERLIGRMRQIDDPARMAIDVDAILDDLEADTAVQFVDDPDAAELPPAFDVPDEGDLDDAVDEVADVSEVADEDGVEDAPEESASTGDDGEEHDADPDGEASEADDLEPRAGD